MRCTFSWLQFAYLSIGLNHQFMVYDGSNEMIYGKILLCLGLATWLRYYPELLPLITVTYLYSNSMFNKRLILVSISILRNKDYLCQWTIIFNMMIMKNPSLEPLNITHRSILRFTSCRFKLSDASLCWGICFKGLQRIITLLLHYPVYLHIHVLFLFRRTKDKTYNFGSWDAPHKCHCVFEKFLSVLYEVYICKIEKSISNFSLQWRIKPGKSFDLGHILCQMTYDWAAINKNSLAALALSTRGQATPRFLISWHYLKEPWKSLVKSNFVFAFINAFKYQSSFPENLQSKLRLPLNPFIPTQRKLCKWLWRHNGTRAILPQTLFWIVPHMRSWAEMAALFLACESYLSI